ncbi:MAG: hypothetical protein US83_C0006G0061 [Candidatus Falkowbacteria bacterium GW2011_GWC2_38_22]|uniref:Uncharacterized protein n=1 Tax=Candidatus Falkowbacteria bacterium GW2011_GWE1_38_31 TaxID=1618638 RepID=A0A0G0K6M6_9BACT|nr:MAG: hypothetical protein US73_C0001G0027 [Candidatus Falkowbacteria bacterium GW2011_GWF2_38_1205]KKQ61421.1 MAG: hypothetical protein US83_C0006G0061 [Candidatus Falkowbacteria bacterium GW2011_GWC2_38_22]KKQ63995.1 MAG: hypothetical protein US84_C0002G0027 [Candidatus Falkowbacteria bacterium GW2011_GWF1_38_22]KKQ66657.1 MAG: hypothetical protein US87_C0001G0178 [Candidatus Falkowbacteria bacterium GW2011_GWE2_38_254]KKQ71100.1 MAG: hypothetical protein US91_C0001G0027 [Candidatus Falkowb
MVENGSPMQTKLAELKAETEERIKSVQNAAVGQGIDVESQYETYKQRLDEKTADIEDPVEKDRIRKVILAATIQSVQKDQETGVQDIAGAVFGLRALVEQLGIGFKLLETYTEEEQAIIDLAKEELTEAKQKWFASRRAAAEKIAEQNIREAQTKAEEMRRERLYTSDMRDSLQDLQYMAEQMIEILENRVEIIESRYQASDLKRRDSLDKKEKAAKEMSEIDQEIIKTEAQLSEEEQLQTTLDADSEAYAIQDTKVKNLRVKVEDLRGQYNVVHAIFNAEEYFAEEHLAEVITATKLRDGDRMWIASLRSDTLNRVITFQNRLDFAKAMSDIEYTKQLDKVGTAVDQDNMEFAAKVAIASDKARLEKLQSHPERMKKAAEVLDALAEHIANDRFQLAELHKQFMDKYGIDPLDSSFFSYEKTK